MNERPIGVFDSGLGGLTVFQAMADLLPSEHLVYLGDTARYPYGPKSREELQRYSVEITDFLLELGVKMVVVACNSATAAALELLQERYSIPIIGVVEPGVRAAVSATRTRRVGVIGTEMTARSAIYEHVSERLRTGLELTTQACPGFVELVEAGETRSRRARQIVADRLEPLQELDIDTLVLGCTHYPLLARTISEALGRDVTLVSSADETAFEVRHIMETTGWGREGDTPGTRRFYTTGDPERFRKLGQRFLGTTIEDVRAHRWSDAAPPSADEGRISARP